MQPNELNALLVEIRNNSYIVVAYGLLTLIMGFSFLAYLMYQDNGGRWKKIANLAKQATVKQARKLYKIRKNLGAKSTKPDALPLLEKYVIEYWLKTQPRIMEFTERVWLPIIRAGNFTRDDWKPLMNRWTVEGLVAQKDPTAKTGKGTALVAVRGEIGMERKLTVILSNSPANDSQMPNIGK